MAPDSIVITVDSDMAELIPLFLSQRKADQAAIAAALPLRDFERVRKAGHGMAGAGASYGFGAVTVLGDNLALAARAGDVARLAQLKTDLDDYLARLIVKYV